MSKQIVRHSLGNPQQISTSGRIQVPKKAWIFRCVVLIGFVTSMGFILNQAVLLGDPFMIHSSIVPVHHLLLLVMAWFFFKNPARGKPGNELVSVVIPIYNQKSMIRIVIEQIFQSTYKNLEVIAVNDGSNDGTKKVLDELSKEYSKLKVIHKKNKGKRKAIGTGVSASKGKFIVFIDSDSVVDPKSIEEFMKAFNADKKIGAVVANAKAWNNKKNIITKLQNIWYDVQFNIHKCAESKFNTVICCSGCMCAYRKEAIQDFIPIWIESDVVIGDDRELTSLVSATSWSKKELLSAFAQKRLEYSSKFDDAEDRVLTGQALVEWKTVYVPSAVVYTDVPETLQKFLTQQIRWKKGYFRANFFVSTFFWQKNPVMAFIFYLEFMSSMTLPLMVFTVFIYEPFVVGNGWFSIFFVASQLVLGLIEGIDSRLRNNGKMKEWIFKPLMNLCTTFIVSWAVFPAVLTLKKNTWGTR